MSRPERLHAGDDSGFTLVELLVTMLITGIVLAIAGTFFANIARLTSWSGRDRDATGQAALALDAIRAVVRVAADNATSSTNTDPAVLVAKPNEITLTAFSNTSDTAVAPSRITFSLDAKGYLVQSRQAGTLSADGFWQFSAPPVAIRIAGPFSLTATPTFFTYIDTKGNVMSSAGGLSLAQRKTITFVRVTTAVNGTGPGGAADTSIVTSSIGMPNLQRDVASTISIPDLPTPSATPVPTTPPVTATPSSTPTPAVTATPTSTPTGSGTGTGTGSGGGTGSGTGTPTPTAGTGGGTGSAGGGSGTSTPTPAVTATATATPTPTPTPTATATPSVTATPQKPAVSG